MLRLSFSTGWRSLIVATAAFIAVTGLSRAGSSINIEPTHLDINAQNHFTSLTLTNTGDEVLVFQVATYAWTQKGNADSLTPTHDLLVAPPVLSIAAGTSRIVRVALRDVAPGEREKTYRVVITQVPDKITAPLGVRYIYQLSVPLFVAPSVAPGGTIHWSARYDARGRRVALTLQNAGNIHVRIDELRLFGGFAGNVPMGALKANGDVLAGATKLYEIPVERAPQGTTITVQASAIGAPPIRVAVDLTR